MNIVEKYVMVVDMVRFSKIEGHYTDCYGPEGVDKLRGEIKKIITDGFIQAQHEYEKALMKWDGDGGIFVFDDPACVHDVALGILKSSEKQSKKGHERKDEYLLRCFRVGVAFGELAFDDTQGYSGNALTIASRLESSGKPDYGGCSGEIRICPDTYRRLPEDLRALYGVEESVRAKEHDGMKGKIPAHRMVVTQRAIGEPWIRPPLKPEGAAPPPPKEDCFVISPIDQHNKRIAEVFEKLIVPACRQISLQAKRADHLPGSDRHRIILEQLSKSPMVVAYLGPSASNWNDNVMLEIGYRISVGLPLVMICEQLPRSRRGGKSDSLKNLLPFHLAAKNVIQVPKDPRLSRDSLVAEMKTAIADSSPVQAWNTTYPLVELRFSNIKEDLTMTYISPGAKKLFGLEDAGNPKVDVMIKKLEERMEPAHYKAYMKERFDILANIRDQSMGLGITGPGDDSSSIPKARIPIVFKEDQPDSNAKPKGYLPVITRYLFRKGTMHLSTVYLEVSLCLERHPHGHWTCVL